MQTFPTQSELNCNMILLCMMGEEFKCYRKAKLYGWVELGNGKWVGFWDLTKKNINLLYYLCDLFDLCSTFLKIQSRVQQTLKNKTLKSIIKTK